MLYRKNLILLASICMLAFAFPPKKNIKVFIAANFSTVPDPGNFIRIAGDRSGDIQWIKSTPVNAGQYMTEFGAPLNSLQIK